MLDGQLYLQLDGPLHFNRYRAVTLETEWARQLPWAAAYRDYCRQHEDGCLENGGGEGGQWTSPEAEAMFGPPGEPGTLTGRGSPCWKQRALYDAVRDACGLHADGVRLARISIYDTVAGVSLADALSGNSELDRDGLLDFIERRAVGRS
ncbi:hypothetical protein HGG74_14710 [Arthrobacter sp. E918]|uniref:Uncharacterized protein n=1 Tax=Arthrobacter mobilis TaxID=2724944 RepID=A0A7X6HEM5_9MICC|nr:hypothetical protein [Arthrobacter mobilis]